MNIKFAQFCHVAKLLCVIRRSKLLNLFVEFVDSSYLYIFHQIQFDRYIIHNLCNSKLNHRFHFALRCAPICTQIHHQFNLQSENNVSSEWVAGHCSIALKIQLLD